MLFIICVFNSSIISEIETYPYVKQEANTGATGFNSEWGGLNVYTVSNTGTYLVKATVLNGNGALFVNNVQQCSVPRNKTLTKLLSLTAGDIIKCNLSGDTSGGWIWSVQLVN